MRKRIVGMLAFLSLAIFASTVCAAEQTSVDLYCQSMIISLIETKQYLNKKPIPSEKLSQMEKAMSDLCRSTPAFEARPISKMSGTEVSLINCLGFAEGAYVAHQPKGAPDEPYSILKARREFAIKSCMSDPKRFKDDIFRRGPDYALKQRY